jgi:protein-S-isoprenylcysteine O-methyltransferase Ste14
MFVLARTLVYSTLFVGLLLIFVPGRVLAWSGIVRPAQFGTLQWIGIVVGVTGALLALWCVVSFAVVGHGTPAPFDPPRRLVVRGPYQYVRNPMYVGAALALAGAALIYRSAALLGYLGLFWLITHLFVILYEEPTLRRSFASDYDAYRRRVNRWWPKLGRRESL